LELQVLCYVSRIDPGKYENFTEETYLEFLRRLISANIRGSTDPDVMMKLGTKEVLFQLKNTKIGSVDVEIYKTKEEFTKNFYEVVKRSPEGRVLKQNRGAGGRGVFLVSILSPSSSSTSLEVWCCEAHDASLKKYSNWDEFSSVIASQFLNSQNPTSFLVSMPFYKNVKEGEVRVVMTQNQPICVVHKHPKADENGDFFSCTVKSGAIIEYIYDFKAIQEWKSLTELVISELPNIQEILKITNLPHLWTIDFIKNDQGNYVLGEINCSCFGFGAHQSKVGELYVESIIKSFAN